MSQDDFNNPDSSDHSKNQEDKSIFDKHTHKNPEVRERQLRVMKISSGVLGAFLILLGIIWVSPIGARIAAQLAAQVKDDLTQPTPTATLDLSSLNVASPTPPPTATTLYGGETFSQELPTVTPKPKNTATAAAIEATLAAELENGTPAATGQSLDPDSGEGGAGAIFVTLEPTVPPLESPTPLPTREVINFASSASDLPTLDYELDPRCINEPTRVDYVLCVVRLATSPIEP
ncbi:MAG: hypothetical protein AB8G95_00345 [Anaerolineae bacterium]